MNAQDMISKVAIRHLRNAAWTDGDLQWGLDKAENALKILDDVVDAWSARSAGRPSVADDYADAKKGIDAINALGRSITNLKRLQRRLASLKTARETARLDQKKRQLVNRVLNLEGLDGNKYFRKPQQGYSKAIDVLQDYGIEMDEVVSSHLFNQPEGRITVDLAFTNPDDLFSPIPITNSMLVLTYHQMQSGRFEVVAYLS